MSTSIDRASAVSAILPKLGELPGFNWWMPLHHWPRETMVRFLLEALTLAGAAIAAPEVAAGDDPAAVVSARLREAVAEASLAYEFLPHSYTAGALRACQAAAQVHAELRATRGAEAFNAVEARA